MVTRRVYLQLASSGSSERGELLRPMRGAKRDEPVYWRGTKRASGTYVQMRQGESHNALASPRLAIHRYYISVTYKMQFDREIWVISTLRRRITKMALRHQQLLCLRWMPHHPTPPLTQYHVTNGCHVQRTIFACCPQESSGSQNQIMCSILASGPSGMGWTPRCHDWSILCNCNIQNAIWLRNLSDWYITTRQTCLALPRLAMRRRT